MAITISMTKQNIKSTVRQNVREALAEEMMRLRALLIPYVSDEEQADIERRFGKPTRENLTAKRKVVAV